METIDLFKDWTPEMIADLKTRSGGGSGQGSYQRTDEIREKNSKASEAVWVRMSPQERERFNKKNSFSNMGKIRKPVEKETRVLMSEAQKATWANRTIEERLEFNKKTGTPKMGRPVREEVKKRISEGLTGIVRSWDTRLKISESKFGTILGPDTEEHREKLSISNKEFWDSLSPEELRKKVSEFRGPMGTRGPTQPEFFLDVYFGKRFPSIWGYNGDGSQGVIIGGKIPDFIRLDGVKEVIEVLGTYWHPEEDEPIKIAHYASYGYKCICIWEYDCYLKEELDKIFGLVAS